MRADPLLSPEDQPGRAGMASADHQSRPERNCNQHTSQTNSLRIADVKLLRVSATTLGTRISLRSYDFAHKTSADVFGRAATRPGDSGLYPLLEL